MSLVSSQARRSRTLSREPLILFTLTYGFEWGRGAAIPAPSSGEAGGQAAGELPQLLPRERRVRTSAARCCARRPLLSPSHHLPPEVLGGEQVVETASGMLPEEEERFMSLRAAAALSHVSDAFRLEVGGACRRARA